MLYISMVIPRLTFASLKKGDFWKVYGLFENRHKILMIRVNTKEGSLLKKGDFSRTVAIFREQGIP
jgi:hypothetical protein